MLKIIIMDKKDVKQIIEAAVNVVNMFDQANTNDVIKNLGNRGESVHKAINDLRDLLNKDEKQTIL